VAGLGLAWRAASQTLPATALIGEACLAAAGLLWIGLACVYVAKAFRHPSSVVREFKHPIASNFFAAPSISALLLAAGLAAYTSKAVWLWVPAAAWQISIALILIGRWLSQEFSAEGVTPACFLPIVGNIVAPLAGVTLGFREISWFMFSVGLALWLAVLPVVLHRLMLANPRLEHRMMPMLAIFVSPPAVGCLSYVTLTQQFDTYARILFFTALFFGLLVIRLGGTLVKAPFSPIWWSITFPSAALAAAANHYARIEFASGADVLAWTLLAAATASVAGVAARSAVRLIRTGSCLRNLPFSSALKRQPGSGHKA
jgi:tellurite resistance protein